MAIKIEMLRCFCTVAQTGNLNEAADRLGRTQSALSMTLRQLEEHLGKKLFEGERKNRLSPLGEQVFELAQKQLHQFDDTVQSIEMSARTPNALIRLVSVPSVAALTFPVVVSAMTEQHPHLRLELRDTDSRQVMDALANGTADIGIASGHFPLKGVQSEPLFEDSFGIVCASQHPLAKQEPRPSIEDVSKAPLIRNSLCDQIETPALQDAFDRAGLVIHNTHSLLAMVRTGKWITVLPRTVVQFMPDNLVFRTIDGLQASRQVHLYSRERTRHRDITQEIATVIRAIDWA